MSNPVQEFFAALNANPDDPEAVAGLEQALSEAEAWTDIGHTVPRFARELSDPIQRARFLVHAAYVARNYGQDDDLANELILEVSTDAALEPDDVATALVAAFEPAGDWRGLVSAGMDIIDQCGDDRISARVFNVVGRAYEDRLYERERAITCYQRAFKLDHRFTEPLHAARSVYAHADQWTTVAKLYEIELRVTEDPLDQARLLKELGQVELERLGERDRAAETLRRAAALDPDLSGLGATIADIENDTGAHGVIISPEALEDPQEDSAAEELAAAVDIRPVTGTPDIVEGVIEEDLADEPVEEDTSAEDEDAEYDEEEASAEDEEAEYEEEEASAEDEEAEYDEEEASAEDEEAEYEEEEASAEQEEASAEDEEAEYEEEEASAEQEEASAEDEEAEYEEEEASAEDEEAEYEEEEASAEDEEAEYEEEEASAEQEEASAEDEEAEYEEEEASAEDEEAEYEEEEASAEDEDAEYEEEDASAEGEDAEYEEEEASAEDEGEAEEPEEDDEPSRSPVRPIVGAEDYLDALVVEAGDTADPASALDAWAWALELGARTERDADELADWVVDAVVGSEDGLEVVRRLLPPLVGRKDVWEAVVRGLEEARADDQDVDGALYGATFYGLGDVDGASRFRSAAGAVGAAEAAAMEFAKKGNWRKAQGALQEAHADSPEAEVDAYFDQAFLAIGLGNEAKASDSLRRVLRKRKGDPTALFFVKFLYRAEEKWGPLAEAIKHSVASVPESDPFRRSVSYRDLIVLYRDELKQPRNVLAAYKELVEADPSDTETLDEYAALLEELNRPQDLVPVLRLKADAVVDTADKVAIHLEVAGLLIDRFNNQPEAITSYEQVLELDPAHAGALSALEDLYEKRRVWDSLIDVKRRMVELADDDEARAAKYRECAEIAATRMRDQGLAVQMWQDALDISPDDPTALEALERLYERDKDWSQLAEVLERRIPGIEDAQERALALVKLGQIQSDRLDDTEGSIRTYEDLLALDPENFRAKDALKKAYIELERWDALERFFESQDAWPEYVRQLESLAGSLTDSHTQVELLFRAADVWSDRLGDEGRATKALERVLSVDETNYRAASRLVPVYEERSDFKRLAPLLEVVLERETDPASRFEIDVKLARLASERQKDSARAFRWFAAALDELPERADILEELELAAAGSGEWDALVDVLAHARSRIAGEPELQGQWVAMSLRLGAVYEREVDDPDAALGCYDEVLDVDETNVVALDAKDGIFTRQENWDALLDVLETKLALADDDAARIPLLERVCAINEEHRDDPEAAARGYRGVLDLDPDNLAALAALQRLYRADGDYAALAEVLERLIVLHGERGETDLRRNARLELAEIRVDALDAAAGAVAVLEEVVGENPGDAGARSLLERLLAEDDQRFAVARILEPLYEADAAWPQLADVLEIQVDESRDASRQASLLGRIGEIQRFRLGDPDSATDAYSRLLRAAPGDRDAQRAIEEIADETGAWEPVTELYESLMMGLDPSDEAERALAVEIGTRTAGFFHERLGDPSEAIRMHSRVLEVEPTRTETMVTLENLFRQTEQWEDLLRVMGDRMALTEDPHARRDLHFEAARIWQEMLDASAEAIDEYRKVLDIFPDDRVALHALDDMYAATADSASRAEVIEQLVRLADEDSAEQLELRNRLARVYEDELGEVPRAMELWQSVLAVDPANESALQGLEAQLETEDYATAASEVLEPLYVAQGAPARLARLLEIRLLHVDAPSERKDLYHRIAGLHVEDMGNRAAAYDVLARAAEEFLGDASVIDRLYEFAAQLGAMAELAERLERLADDAVEPQVIRDTLVRVARIREDRLADVDAAAGLWRRVLEENPGDTEALDALERIDEFTEDWDELVDVLLRKAQLPEAAADPAQYKPLMFRAALIQEEMLGHADEAIEVFRSVLMSDPSDADAIAQLERLYTQTARWDDLVDNYHRKLETAETDDERRDLYATLGAVLETELEEPDRAIDAFRAILEIDPSDLQALHALERLYRSTEQWLELLEILGKQATLLEDDGQRRGVQFQIGRLYDAELMDYRSAVETYRAILEEDPGHAASREALQELVVRGDEALYAAQILEPIYRSEGLWHELVAINRTLIENADLPSDRRAIHVDIARVLESQLADAKGAIDAYSAACREETHVEDLDQIERLAPVVEAWPEVCELFVELWEDVADPALRSQLGLRVARIREEELGELDAAVASYARLHEEDPTQQQALEALDRLYGQSGQPEALADILQKRIFAGGAANDTTALRLRLARTYFEGLDEPTEAVTVYRELLAEDDRNGDAITALEDMIRSGQETYEIASILEPLYRQHGDWSKLVALNQTRIQADATSDERYRLWMDTADVYEQRVGDKAAALNALGNALFEMPGDPDLKARIEALGGEIDHWGVVADIYTMLLEQELDDADRLDTAVRLAVVREDALGDVAGAESAYLAVLEVEPAHPDALRALDRIYTAQDRWSEVASVVGRLREAVFEPAEVTALAFRHATIYRDRLGDVQRAIDTFHEVLEVDPGHRPSLDALTDLYTLVEDWEALFDVYERMSVVTADDAERASIAIKMATLATDQLDRPMDAIDMWQAVLAAQPEDRQALGSLAVLYERTEQYNDLADVLDRTVAIAEDDDERAALLRRSGRMWAEVLDNQDQAIVRFERLLRLAPEDAAALFALRDLYETVGDFEKLVGVLERLLQLGAIPEGEEVEVHRQLGTILADTLVKPAEAVAAWRRVVEFSPHDAEALDRLEQLYIQDGDWQQAVGIVERKVESAADPDDQIELLKRIAGVWSGQLNDPAQAAHAFERVLELDLADFDATTALEGIYEQTERWGDLATLCVDRLEVVEDPWDRLQLFRRAAEIYEQQLEQPDGAFVILGSAALENPTDPELRAELERLAAVADKHADLVETYRGMIARLEQVGEDEAVLSLLLAVGKLQDEQLGDGMGAETTYERILELDPENDAGLTALEGIHTRAGSWASLVGVLRRRVNLTYDVPEQITLHKRIGELFETRLDDTIEAIEAYKMVLRLDEADADALAALERIYEAGGEWRELVDVLERKAENTFEPADLVALHSRIGEIWQAKLGVADRAVESYHNVLDHDPGHLPSLRALEVLYAGLDKWEKFLDIIDAQLMIAAEDSDRVALYAKQALVQEEHFDDVDSAIGSLQSILAIDPKDLDAIGSLERIFQEQERIPDLIDTYQRHVDAVEEVDEQTRLLCLLGQAQVEHLDDAHAAIDAYRRVLELDGHHAEALARIGSLYENVGRADYAVEAYERLARITEDPATRLRLLFRAGQLSREPLGDVDAAVERFSRCLEIDEAYLPALEALEEIHSERNEWDTALEMLHRQIEFTRDLVARSSLMVRQAGIYRSHLDDPTRAQELYETAIELDPSNVGAAGPLADIFFDQQDWVRAQPLYELQLASDAERSDDDALRLNFRAGFVAEQLGFDDQATTLYERVIEAELGHLGALRGLARLYTRLGREDEAYQAYIDILAEHRNSMEPEEAVDCYYRAGSIKLAQEDLGGARHMFLNALEIDENHTPSIRDMLTIVEQSGDVQAVVEFKKRLLPMAADDLEKFKLLVEIGDAYLGLDDAAEAEEAYREAVRVDPDSKVVLHKLLNIFTSTGNWRRATEVLGQLARMEDDPERLAKLCFTIAAIFRDELGEMEKAVEFFNQALDARFEYLEAFEAIDHLLTSARDWKALEQNYRRMLGRVESEGDDASDELKVTLLKNLGEIYRSRMQQYEDAIAAYRLASQLAPDDEVLLTILAELIEKAGGPKEDLIVQHQRLIGVSPFRIESYRALFKAFIEERKFDEAWCMASALSLLQKASAEEEKYYNKYLPKSVREARPNLTGAHWKDRLYHADLDRNVTNLFEVLGTHLRPLIKREPKDWGVHKRKDRVDLEQAMPLTKMLSYAMTEIGVPDIGLYEKQEHVGIVNMNCDPPAVIAGRDMFTGKGQLELAFQVAKAITLMRPEFYLASAYPSTEHLKVFFFAAAAAVTGQLVGDGDTKAITDYAQEVRDLPPPVFEQVRRAVSAIFESGKNPDLSAWLRAVDHTASRAGLLICGDLRTAVSCIKLEADRGQALSKADMKERVRELVLFSISDPHFALRRDLGLALQPK